MGSKNKIAKDILPFILKHKNEVKYYFEPFVGGANIIDKVDNSLIKKGSDLNPYLIALLQALQDDNWNYPKEYDNEYYNGSPKTNLMDKARDVVCELYHTISNGYLWESGYDDFFTEIVQRYKKPCYELYRYFNLKHGKDDNSLYIQDNQELACIDLNHCLYFKKNLITDFLKENRFCLIWFVKCEKMISNSDSFDINKTYKYISTNIHKLDSKNILE